MVQLGMCACMHGICENAEGAGGYRLQLCTGSKAMSTRCIPPKLRAFACMVHACFFPVYTP